MRTFYWSISFSPNNLQSIVRQRRVFETSMGQLMSMCVDREGKKGQLNDANLEMIL